MPKFELLQDDKVLCFMMSGKFNSEGRLVVQRQQDGSTCTFFSHKRVAKTHGHAFSNDDERKRYRAISDFRKMLGRLDGAVLMAAELILANYNPHNLYEKTHLFLFMNAAILKAHHIFGKALNTMMLYFFPKGYQLSRQLKLCSQDEELILNLFNQYKNQFPGHINQATESNRKKIIEWLMGENVYQNEFLKAAFETSSKLSKIPGSTLQDSDWHTTKQLSLFPNQGYQPHTPDFIFIAQQPHNNFQPELDTPLLRGHKKQTIVEFYDLMHSEIKSVYKHRTCYINTAEQLMQKLKTYGPLIVSGYYGQEFYHHPPKAIKDENNKTIQFGSRKLLGWRRGEYKSFEEISLISMAHQIIIIGIDLNANDTQKSSIIFIDPNTPSYPNEKRKAFVMSFNRLVESKLSRTNEITAFYSSSDNVNEKVFQEQTESKQGCLCF